MEWAPGHVCLSQLQDEGTAHMDMLISTEVSKHN